MSAIQNALSDIIDVIPREILTEVFGKEDYRDWRRDAPVSIDEMIMSKVIRRRVIKDCNIIGGRQVLIDVKDTQVTNQDGYTSIYYVPPEKINYREVISVLSVGYHPNSMSYGGTGAAFGVSSPSTQSDVSMTAMRVMDSASSLPHVSSAHIELIAYNTVLIRDRMRASQIYNMRALVSYDENLSDIPPKAWEAFSEACQLAVQAYIWKELRIKLGRGRLEQGQELTEFKDAVEEYRDSEKEYKEFKKRVLEKTLFQADVNTQTRHIRSMINPSI